MTKKACVIWEHDYAFRTAQEKLFWMKSKWADGIQLGSLILIISDDLLLMQNNTASENNVPEANKQKLIPRNEIK